MVAKIKDDEVASFQTTNREQGSRVEWRVSTWPLQQVPRGVWASNYYNMETDGQTATKMTRPKVEMSQKDLEELEDSISTTTDELLRDTLLAMQGLIELPKAWRRNSRGSGPEEDALLGTIELEKALPLKEVSIHVATWNMNGKEPPSLKPWILPEEISGVPDIVVASTQESHTEHDDLEISLQEVIGPSHVMFHSTNFGTLHLVIFIRRELIWFLSVADEDTLSLRIGAAIATRGAAAVAFYLFGTSFLFITSHLTPHKENLKERIHDIQHIIKGLKLPHKLPSHNSDKDVTENFDYVFWSGDLNFRLAQPRSDVVDWISSQDFPLTEPVPDWLNDQLTHSIMDGSILKGFEEGPLTFAPTFKFDVGTSTYDTSSKQRTPSYTDRILYKRNTNGSDTAVQCTGYGSVPSVCTSDHKPVWGRYTCPIQPGIHNIPLNAGHFNRDVYLEAIKRR